MKINLAKKPEVPNTKLGDLPAGTCFVYESGLGAKSEVYIVIRPSGCDHASEVVRLSDGVGFIRQPYREVHVLSDAQLTATLP